MKAGIMEMLGRALDAKSEIDGYCTIKIESDWKIAIYADPSDIHKAVSALTPLIGRLEKKQSYGSTLDFFGENEDFNIHIVSPEKCVIRGYKITKEERPKVVETITDEMEVFEQRIAITDCDIKAGKYTEADIEVPA